MGELWSRPGKGGGALYTVKTGANLASSTTRSRLKTTTAAAAAASAGCCPGNGCFLTPPFLYVPIVSPSLPLSSPLTNLMSVFTWYYKGYMRIKDNLK